MPGFDDFLAAAPDDRRDAFLAAGRRLGTPEQNVEKDFWVCWTLNALFNQLPAGSPRLLFKGGTSLSKAFGLISRFSEDIDITVFRDDLGEEASIEALEALSNKKRRAKLDAIREACQAYIAGPLRARLGAVFKEALERAEISTKGPRLELDPDDPDRQSILLWYPSVTVADDGYIRPVVKLEAGAKSALDPHHLTSVMAYVGEETPGLSLTVGNITVVDAGRSFWDKVVILHGLRRWFDKRQVLRGGGQRVSRHYYDVHRLYRSETGAAAIGNTALGQDCVRHARMFFSSTDLDLASAAPCTFSLVPTPPMLELLERDYRAMAGMIFGPIPPFGEVMASVAELEQRVNQQPEP
ncbi:MAG: nucleotidyl transferase AbiEii/AbiGii toxin family protein [Rhizomicrobium sp.]